MYNYIYIYIYIRSQPTKIFIYITSKKTTTFLIEKIKFYYVSGSSPFFRNVINFIFQLKNVVFF